MERKQGEEGWHCIWAADSGRGGSLTGGCVSPNGFTHPARSLSAPRLMVCSWGSNANQSAIVIVILLFNFIFRHVSRFFSFWTYSYAITICMDIFFGYVLPKGAVAFSFNQDKDPGTVRLWNTRSVSNKKLIGMYVYRSTKLSYNWYISSLDP